MPAERARGWRPWLIGSLLTLVVHHAAAVELPGALVAAGPWQQQGGGEARWLGLRLYDAALWVPGGRWDWGAPFALSLRYARSFSSERLVDSSIDEMRRLFAPEDGVLARWRAELAQAFPDVEEGDVLVGEYRPGQGAAFYSGGQLRLEIVDAELARSFFSIWLDPRTRSPELRAQLLGLEDAR